MNNKQTVTTKPKKAFIQTNTLFNYFGSNRDTASAIKPSINTITNYFLKPATSGPTTNQPQPQATLTSNFKIKKEQTQTSLSSLLKSETKTELKSQISLADVSSSTSQRKCPFYKRVENTQICVDAFSYGDIDNCNAYFLSHYHYDHFIGLKKDFKNLLLCSKVTANLVVKNIKVDRQFIRVLDMNRFQDVYEDDSAVQVALIDANQ